MADTLLHAPTSSHRQEEDLVPRGQGKERERGLAYVDMFVSVDGDHVLHVHRLRWKLHGSKKVDLGSGDQVLVS
jgi:hypothetical protein